MDWQAWASSGLRSCEALGHLKFPVIAVSLLLMCTSPIEASGFYLEGDIAFLCSWLLFGLPFKVLGLHTVSASSWGLFQDSAAQPDRTSDISSSSGQQQLSTV